MGLIDKIKSIFRKKDHKLLGDGSQGAPERKTNENNRSEFRKEIKEATKINLTPEQWQMKFLEESGCGKYTKNPFMVKFLTSIPEIACIKDEESLKKAMEYNYSVLGKDLRFPYEEPYIYMKGNREDIFISFQTNTSSQDILVYRSRENQKKEIKSVYDTDTGIEIERYCKYNDRISYGYKRSNKSFGLVEMSGNYPEVVSENLFFDLTQSSNSDIGTLDGIEFDEMDSFVFNGSGHGKQIRKEEFEINYNGTKDKLAERVNKKILNSVNSNACKKYAGISEPENEKEN